MTELTNSIIWQKFVLLAIFGIAIAHLEGVVVVYLRKAIDSNVVKFTKYLLNFSMKELEFYFHKESDICQLEKI